MAKHKTGKKAPLGEGGRFKALKKSIGHKSGVRNPGAVAAKIGREKYGQARFQALAAKGKRDANKGGAKKKKQN